MLDKKSKKRLALKILGYVTIIVLFIIIIESTDFKSIVKHLKRVEESTFVLLICLQVITQLLLAFQWSKITKRVIGKSSFIKILYIFTRGSVIEAITPGAKIGGEATRVYYLKKDFNCKTVEAVNIVLIQKCISMSVLLSICVISFVYLCSLITIHLSVLVQVLIAVLCLILIFFMVSLLFFSEKLIKLFSLNDNKLINKIKGFIKNYNDATKKLNRKSWLLQFSISAIVWLLFPIKMLIIAHSFRLDIPFLILLAITMTSYMIGMFPITPGGLGTFEATMIALFSILSINNGVSVAITIIFRFITHWFVILISLVFVVGYKIVKNIKRRKAT